MSTQYYIESIAQPSLYDPCPRKMMVYFSLPDSTRIKGLLLLLAGFGGHAQSNVFRKMRDKFADEFGLVVVQCNYFGWEFMQEEVKQERPKCFCDMGPVQTMDNLIALKVVTEYLDEKGIPYDRNNVIAYGFSHGAYLAYMMNAFMPGVLSSIIDNSAWLYPGWIDNNRLLITGEQRTEFRYIISEILMDPQIYDIEWLYDNMENQCNIISFHGMNDFSIAPIDKKIIFSSKVPKMSIEIIGEERVDHKMFHSAGHGLDADFLAMFYHAMKKYCTRSDMAKLVFENNDLSTDKVDYHIRNEDGIPILYYELKVDYDFEQLVRYEA